MQRQEIHDLGKNILAAIHALALRTKSLAEVPATGLKVQVDYGQKVTFIKKNQLVMRNPLNDVGTAVKSIIIVVEIGYAIIVIRKE